MASQVGVPPLTGLIFNFCSTLRVKILGEVWHEFRCSSIKGKSFIIFPKLAIVESCIVYADCIDLNPIDYVLNRLSHIILERYNFNFRYIRLWDLHIPREKWLNYLQTVETLIRHRILRHLIWVCTVCQLPFYGSLNYNGLNGQSKLRISSSFHL